MHQKQKVTLYIPPGLHRQLKIRAAVDTESMSALVEKAVAFYLEHSDVVDELEATHGQTYRVYACPECEASLVQQEAQLVSLKKQPSVLSDELPVEKVREPVNSSPDSQGEEELVPC